MSHNLFERDSCAGDVEVSLRFIALTLGLAGWITYFILWSGVRLFGFVTLTFGDWGPSWLEWFELWIEPVILISWMGLIIWVLLAEIFGFSTSLANVLSPLINSIKRMVIRKREPVQLVLPLKF